MALVHRSLRLRLAVVGVAVVAAVGVVLWNRNVADGDDDLVLLDEPGEYADPSVSNPPNDGEGLPDVELTSAAGDPLRLTTDGRPMVVNLWYSTCPPCARELTYFADVEADVGGDVRFVGVNPLDDVDTMTRFAAERDVDYELLLDSDGAFADALRIVQYPVTLFVDGDGRIVDQTGVLGEAELREHLAELLT